MEDYDFWKSLFETYQSLPDWLKLVWMMLPYAVLVVGFYIYMRYRAVEEEIEEDALGDQKHFLKVHTFKKCSVCLSDACSYPKTAHTFREHASIYSVYQRKDGASFIRYYCDDVEKRTTLVSVKSGVRISERRDLKGLN